jgi:hypothetical protein
LGVRGTSCADNRVDVVGFDLAEREPTAAKGAENLSSRSCLKAQQPALAPGTGSTFGPRRMQRHPIVLM